jgi:hypothetical protein
MIDYLTDIYLNLPSPNKNQSTVMKGIMTYLFFVWPLTAMAALPVNQQSNSSPHHPWFVPTSINPDASL